MTLSLLQLQYDQYSTGSQTAGLVVKGLFIADQSKRLLLTDFAAQLDVELAHYRTACEATVKLLLPQIDAALLVCDVDVLAQLLLDVNELVKKLPAGEAPSDTKNSMDWRICAEIASVKSTLSDRIQTLLFSAEELHVQLLPQKEEKDCILSLRSVQCSLDDQMLLFVQPLPEANVCLQVEREQREQPEQCEGTIAWYSLAVGDLFLCVCWVCLMSSNATPELLDLVAVAPLKQAHILQLLSQTLYSQSAAGTEPSVPGTASEEPEEGYEPSPNNTGFSLTVQSIQARLSVPHNTSLLFASSHATVMKAASVFRLELERCCAAVDSNGRFIPSWFASTDNRKLIMNECSVMLNIDTSAAGTALATRHVVLNVQDFVLSVEDALILSLSTLYHSFAQRATAIQEQWPAAPSEASVPASLDSDVRASDSAFRFSLQEDEVPASSLPSVLSLEPLQVVMQEGLPELGQLLVTPTVSQMESEEVESSVLSYPTLDYYRLVSGGVPHPLTAESLHKNIYEEKNPSASSFFSFFSASKKPSELHHVTMQFRLPSMIRVFSIRVKQLLTAEINALAGGDIAAVFGDSFEFDLLAWSEMNRSFHCIKSVCVPIRAVSPTGSAGSAGNAGNAGNAGSVSRTNRAGTAASLVSDYKRSHYYTDGAEDSTSSVDSDASLTLDEAMHETVLENSDQTEFFEMTPPYSYSNRYQICVYLRGYVPGEMTHLGGLAGVVRAVTAVVQKRVALKYFSASVMNQYTLFSFTSNMLLFRFNHASCHSRGAPVEALQLAVVKPKLLYRRSLDCHELSLYGSINLNAINLMSLLLMPLVQKFDVYSS